MIDYVTNTGFLGPKVQQLRMHFFAKGRSKYHLLFA